MKHDSYMDGSGCLHVMDWCTAANVRNLASYMYCRQASPPALYAYLTMSLRYASMSCTLLGCLSATIAVYVVKHCTHVGSYATSRARLPTTFTASPRDVPSSRRCISMLFGSKSAMSTNSSAWIFYQLCWHGSERFTKKEWTFLLASGRGDFGFPCNRCLVSIFSCSSMGTCSNAIAAGITPRSVSLPAHQGLSNCGTELNYNARVQSVPSPCKATLPQ